MTSLRKLYLKLIEKGPDSLLGWMIFLGLWPLSFFYGLIVRLRLLAYPLGLKKKYYASVPVISVGNLSVGGTGKTPMTDFLVKRIMQHELPVAIVSRGYGGNYSEPFVRVNPEGVVKKTPAECGDEPVLLARRNPAVPVFVARVRALGVKAAENSGAKLIILDDGFQHRAVHRDMDIVLLDSERPYGNGHLLPAGQLREPKSALKRSHLIVMTRVKSGMHDMPVMAKPTMYSRHVMAQDLTSLSGEVVNMVSLVGKSCVAFAGIARPDDFFVELKRHNLSIVKEIPLTDHQSYDAELVEQLMLASRTCDALITTEKDAVKLSGVEFPVPCYQVGVELVFEDTSLLDDSLNMLLAKNTSHEQEKN